MAWHKQNMVSNKDLTDTWECTGCGFVARYRIGGRPPSCPECMKKKPFGWWSISEKNNCGICLGKAKLVPKEGHELSEFWSLERNGEKLYYCPHGCLDGESTQDIIRKLRKKVRELEKLLIV